MRTAITGGIAEGKSTVLGYLRDAGYSVASSDAMARDLFVTDSVQAGLAVLLDQDPPVDPQTLREALAASSGLRRDVNRLLHPGIVARIQGSQASFVEVPLLIEACLHRLFDQVWVVTCGSEEQRLRLAKRDGPGATVRLLESQLKTSAKTPFGDLIVRTNEPEGTVKRYVQRAASRVELDSIARFGG